LADLSCQLARTFRLKQRPEHRKASCEDEHDGKHCIKKLIPPSRYKITIKQQPKGRRMIVEDHDMLDCLATYGYKLRPDRDASLLSLRCSTRQPVGSNHHHSFLKCSKIAISQNVKFPSKCGANRRTSALERGPLDIAALGVVFGHFTNDLQESQQRAQPLGLTAGVQQHETVVEFTYRFAFIRSALYFRPDLQYIIRPGGTGRIPNALALGAQVGVNF